MININYRKFNWDKNIRMIGFLVILLFATIAYICDKYYSSVKLERTDITYITIKPGCRNLFCLNLQVKTSSGETFATDVTENDAESSTRQLINTLNLKPELLKNVDIVHRDYFLGADILTITLSDQEKFIISK